MDQNYYEMELTGKSVVVVGGLGGIGYATSKLLLTKQISVWILYFFTIIFLYEYLNTLEISNS